MATFPGAFLLFNVALYIIVMFMSAWVYLAMKKAGVLSGAEMEVKMMESVETKERLMMTVQSDGEHTGEIAFNNEMKIIERKF